MPEDHTRPDKSIYTQEQVLSLIDRLGEAERELRALVPAADRGKSAVVDDMAGLVNDLRTTLKGAYLWHGGYLQHLPAIVFELNAGGDIVYVSDAIQPVLGFTPDEATGVNLWMLVSPDCDEGRIEELSRTVKAHGVSDYELSVKSKDGASRVLQVTTTNVCHLDGSLDRVIGHAVDITDRRQAERLRDESEGRHRAVFHNALDGMVVQEFDGHGFPARIVDVNNVVCEMLGYDREEMLSMDHMVLHEPERVESLHEYAREVNEKGRVSFSTDLIRKNGERVPVDISAHTFELAGNKVMLTSVRDVTERRRSRQALCESEERFRELVDNLPQAVFEMDLAGKVLFMNKNGLDRLGYTEADVRNGYNALDAVEASGREQARQNIAGIVSGQADTGREYNIVRSDGSIFPARIYSHVIRREGRPVGLRGIIFDTTEIKQVEESLRESRRFVERITELTPDLQYLFDLETHTMPFSNHSLRSFMGYTSEDALDAGDGSAPDLVHPDDLPRVVSYLAGLSDTKDGEVREICYRVLHADGAWRWMRSRDVIFSRLPDGRPKLVLGTARDITDRKLSEEALLRQTARAEALADVAGQLNAQRDLQSVLRLICKETARAMSIPAVSVALCDGREDAMLSSAWTPAVPDTFARKLRSVSLPTIEQYIKEHDTILVIPDIQELPTDEDLSVYLEFDVRTSVFVALMRDHRLIGSLNLFTFGERRDLEEDDINLLRGLAHQASQAIINAQLIEDANRHVDFLQALRDVDKAITASLDLGIILDIFLNQVMTQLGVHAADILLLDQYSQILEFAAGTGLRARSLRDVYLRLGDGYAGRSARERRMVHVPDLDRTVHAMTRAPQLASEGFTDYYAVPLIAKGRVQGVLEIFNREPIEAHSDWLEFLEALAGQAAIAVDNATMFETQQRANTEMLLAYDATLEGWSRALDVHGRETEGHSLRVADMMVALAQALDLPRAEIVHMRRGALLHDIGMMAIPDGILLKPGPLSDDEWEMIRKHPVYAYELLSTIGFLRPALDIPYCHHEKWDGAGYPRGLKGVQIPVAARAFAIVDVWDSLRSDRPYRQAWSRDSSIQHIREHTGSHFDPGIVEVFMNVVKRF